MRVESVSPPSLFDMISRPAPSSWLVLSVASLLERALDDNDSDPAREDESSEKETEGADQALR